MRSEVATHDPVAVSRVSLEADPAGSRIDLVVVDRSGQGVGVSGARHRVPDVRVLAKLVPWERAALPWERVRSGA